MTSLEEIFQNAQTDSVDLEGVLHLAGQDLCHYARVLTGSPELAEDAVQDTLVALLELGAQARSVECTRAWLFTVLLGDPEVRGKHKEAKHERRK